MRKVNLLGSAAAATLLVAVGAGPALATDGEHEVGLHQSTPVTADDPEFDLGEECSGIPEGSDGWHFVLPGTSTTFVELRVIFEPGGEQVVTTFGPPSDKHAFVASEAGAELVEATATVAGEPVDFRLSHTCPAGAEPEEEPSQEPGTRAGDEPETLDEEESEGMLPNGGGEESPTAAGDDTSSGEAGEASEAGEAGEDLASTGSGLPVVPVAVSAAALVAGGGYLVLRRRRATTGS